MKRRQFTVLATGVILSAPLGSLAQTDLKPPIVGMLSMARNPELEGAFLDGLAERGYTAEHNIRIEWRSAEGRADQLVVLARELVRLPVDLLIAGGPEARIAAMQATATLPILVIGGADPVSEGWASNLAYPGGNVTGLTVSIPGLTAKKLELLSDLIPNLSRVAVLGGELTRSARYLEAEAQAIQAAARTLSVDVMVIDVRHLADFEGAFQKAVQHQRQALIINETALVFEHRAAIVELARQHRLPIIGDWQASASAGFLATYGADLSDLLRRIASYVDKILKGEAPGSLPIERPAKFALVINLKTAETLGLTLPSSILLRANEVVE